MFFLMPPLTALLDFFVLGKVLTVFKAKGFVLAARGVYLGTHTRSGSAQEF